MRNFLRALVKAFAYIAVSPLLLAEWCYRQSPAYQTTQASVAEDDEDASEIERDREYALWVAEQQRQAQVSRAKQTITDAERLERGSVAYARARLRGEDVDPRGVVAFFAKHDEPPANDDQEPKGPKAA